MKVRVNVDHGAAVRAGSNVSGVQVVDVDLAQVSPAAREIIAGYPVQDGVINMCAPHSVTPTVDGAWDLPLRPPVLASADPVAVIAWLEQFPAAVEQLADQVRAEMAEHDRKLNALIAECATKIRDQRYSHVVKVWCHRVGGKVRYEDWDCGGALAEAPGPEPLYYPDSHRLSPAGRARYEQAQAEIEQVAAKLREALKPQALAELEREEAARSEKERIKEAAEAQRRALEAEAVAAAPEDVRERHAAGVLPQDELNRIVRNRVFRDLADLPRYQNLTVKDVDHEEGCYENEVNFSSDEADEVDSTTWAAAKAIRSRLQPTDTSVIRRHTASCDCDSPVAVRYGLSVERRGVRREFAL